MVKGQEEAFSWVQHSLQIKWFVWNLLSKRVSGKKPLTWDIHSVVEESQTVAGGPGMYRKTHLRGEEEDHSGIYNRRNDKTLACRLWVTQERQKLVIFWFPSKVQLVPIKRRGRRRGCHCWKQSSMGSVWCIIPWLTWICLPPSFDTSHLIVVSAQGATEFAGCWLRPPFWGCTFLLPWKLFFRSSGLFSFCFRSTVMQKKELTSLVL